MTGRKVCIWKMNDEYRGKSQKTILLSLFANAYTETKRPSPKMEHIIHRGRFSASPIHHGPLAMEGDALRLIHSSSTSAGWLRTPGRLISSRVRRVPPVACMTEVDESLSVVSRHLSALPTK